MTAKQAGALVLTTADEVVTHVRRYYGGNAWAVFEGVANATGTRASRWADVIAFGLWPSRGMEIHGVEVKVSRSDLMRELDNPEKAEPVAAYCDYWWIAAGLDKLAKPEELPAAWGLLVPCAKKGMRVAKAATKLEPKPLDRGFVAAILRRAAHVYDPERIRQQARGEIFSEERDKAIESVKQEHEREVKHLRERVEVLLTNQKSLQDQLAAIANVPATTQTIGKAMNLLLTLQGWNGAHEKLSGLLRTLGHHEETFNVTKRALGEIRDLLGELVAPKSETGT